MTETHYETVFGGIDANATAATVPGWYRSRHDARRGASVEFDSFHEVVGDLTERFGADKTEVYYHDDERGEYVEIPERSALVNPAWVGEDPSSFDRGSAAWTTASADYSTVEAMDAYGPLVAVAREQGLENAFGSAKTYRHGGQVAAEILFDDLRFEDPQGEAEFVLGFETGYDHYARQSVWASLLAYDVNSGAALRGLSSRHSCPHRGDVTEKLADWFRSMFERVERLDDTLTQVVAEARNYEVPLNEVPLTLAEWYEAQGFPASYSREAAESIRNHREPSAFELYLAIAETVTSEFDGKQGGDALRRHAGRANDILFSPPGAERQALVQARDELRESGQTTLGEGDPAEQLDERIETLDEGVEAFESMRERFRTMIDELSTETDETDGAGNESGVEVEFAEDETGDEPVDENEVNA